MPSGHSVGVHGNAHSLEYASADASTLVTGTISFPTYFSHPHALQAQDDLLRHSELNFISAHFFSIDPKRVNDYQNEKMGLCL